MQSKYFELIKKIYSLPEKELNSEKIKEIKREFAKKWNENFLVPNTILLYEYFKALKSGLVEKNKKLEELLQKRKIRSESGIVPIQVLTKPWHCPGKCIFCPNDPEMPKSYLKSEPGAMRAWLNKFDPVDQVVNRLISLTLTGHSTDKIEMIVLGGTRDVYPEKYKIWFISQLYEACNYFSEIWENVEIPTDLTPEIIRSEKKFSYTIKNFEEIKKKFSEDLTVVKKNNEIAKNRIIGLTIETRPEFVNDKNCKFRRQLGVTRIEMGVQNLFDDVLQANKRGHGTKEIYEAMNILKKWGFKISIHLMPGLYKSNFKKDTKTIKKAFYDPKMRPDEIKFYPTSVLPKTELYKLYKQGKYKPLTQKDIQKIVKKLWFDYVPAFVRIKRLVRDIPSTEIVAGSKVTNFSQILEQNYQKLLEQKPKLRKKIYKRLYPNLKVYETENLAVEAVVKIIKKMQNSSSKKVFSIIAGKQPDLLSQRNFVSIDTRSREVRKRKKVLKDDLNLVFRVYLSSAGVEVFLSFEDELGYLYGLLRLLLPNEKSFVKIDGLGEKCAIVREVHVYGNLAKILEKGNLENKIQHSGLGKKLLSTAEEISQLCDYKKISVISGVGVRKYYEKLGYKLEGEYEVKFL